MGVALDGFYGARRAGVLGSRRQPAKGLPRAQFTVLSRNGAPFPLIPRETSRKNRRFRCLMFWRHL
jgi:hypothetical protein